MSVISLKCYQSLINDRVHYWSQSYGDQGNRALAIVPMRDCSDPRIAVQRVLNLFANFDPRPRHESTQLLDIRDEYPPAPSPRRCYDLTYINITQERLLATLVNYFRAALPSEMGHTVFTNELDEGGPDIDFVYDEEEVERLAIECAEHFVANQVIVRSFMPSLNRYIPEEYGVTFMKPEPVARVEGLVDSCAS